MTDALFSIVSLVAMLAWLLLATIGGHILMVLVHRFIWKDDTAQRMLG